MSNDAGASIREVHALIDASEAKLSAQITALQAECKFGFERHDIAHGLEEHRRTARFRWAVGIALAAGTLLGGFASQLLDRLL